MKYSELLEQQPVTSPSPEVAPNAPENGAEAPKNPDLGQLQSELKLEQLDGKVNPSAYEILQANGTNLMQFLQNGERPERLKDLVNNLEVIFQKVGMDYCHLDSGEAKHMATGIVCSIIDSFTGERNTGNAQPVQPAEGDKTKPAANPFGAWGDVFGNVSKMFRGKEGAGVENALGGMFNQLIGIFGGADVLWQRLKSIFLLIELTRKSREILCPRDAAGKIDANASAATWDKSLIHDPKLFVGSSRIVEIAIKADKDIIQPENIHTLADFQKAIQITQGAATVQYGLLDLLGLREQSVPSVLPIAAQEYFADIDPAALESIASTPEAKQKLATKVLDGLGTAVKQGQSFQDGWSKNRTTLEQGGLRSQVQEWMKALAPLSDTNDPDSLYSTFNKRINFICGLFTGTAFSEDVYDLKSASLEIASNTLSQGHLVPEEGDSQNIGSVGDKKIIVGGSVISHEDAVNKYGSTPAVRNFNPGNIMDTKYGGKKVDGERFTVFDSPQAGLTALVQKILDIQAGNSTIYKPEMTLSKYINVYAPPVENDSEAYATDIAAFLGISIDTKIKDIDPLKLALAHTRFEDNHSHQMLEDLGIASSISVEPVSPAA